MKVRELIEWLEGFDGDKELMMEQNGGEYVSDLEFIDIQEKDGKVWIYD
jgi:hypothetical protein